MKLTGKAKEAVLNMEINELTDKNGVENVTAVLDQMYLRLKSLSIWSLWNVLKICEGTLYEHTRLCTKFGKLYWKGKSFNMEILDSVLAYRLLDSANLYREQKQLVKATVSDINWEKPTL